MESRFIGTARIGKGLLSFGLGGIAAFYMIQFSVIKLLPLSKEMKEIMQNGASQDFGIGVFVAVILLVSLFALLAAPLFFQWDENAGIKILILLLAFCSDAVGMLTVIVRGEIFLSYMVVIWISSIYIAWFSLGIINIVYQWVKSGTENEQLNMVKLTFLWTIIAFIIGKVW